jgi:hypothetical protein
MFILIMLKVLSIFFAHYYTNNTSKNQDIVPISNIKNEYGEYGKYNEYSYPESESESESKSESESESEICMSRIARNFMICWIKYTIDTIDCSKAIVQKLPNFNNYHTNLENTKDELFVLFTDLYKDTNQVEKFKTIINQQISLKISLCYAIKNEDKAKISSYSSLLITNSHELGILFSEIKKYKKNELELKSSLSTHTNLYIKSLTVMKKATSIELTRELVLGSVTTIKLLL